MTFLMLHEVRLQRLGAYALIAVAFMGALNAAFGSSPLGVVRLAALTWIPAATLALLLRSRRSLTLTVQFSVIALLAATLLFFLAQGEANAFGQSLVVQVAEVLRESGYEQQAELLLARQDVAAWQIIGLIVLLLWSSFTLALGAGTAMYKSINEAAPSVGDFRDLDLGRVLAGVTALLCAAALVVDSIWLRSFAFVAFFAFWIQGLAILHWLAVHRSMPRALLIGVYVLLPFLNMLLVVALAVVGYLDAWFGFRKRSSVSAS